MSEQLNLELDLMMKEIREISNKLGEEIALSDHSVNIKIEALANRVAKIDENCQIIEDRINRMWEVVSSLISLSDTKTENNPFEVLLVNLMNKKSDNNQ